MWAGTRLGSEQNWLQASATSGTQPKEQVFGTAIPMISGDQKWADIHGQRCLSGHQNLGKQVFECAADVHDPNMPMSMTPRELKNRPEKLRAGFPPHAYRKPIKNGTAIAQDFASKNPQKSEMSVNLRTFQQLLVVMCELVYL